MVKKVILAIMGLSFALFVSSCEEKTKERTKKKSNTVQQEQIAVERERHHSKW